MFRPTRWRSDKNKIKAVFKLQFHATQVPQLGVDALMVAVVPGDVGKPTVRLEKARVQDGSCRWENPVYETVKFVREPKTGKINERLYHFIVSTGVSRGGLVGEASINFADYAEAIKASTVSLPLKNSNANAVLHISIWRLQENVAERDVEESEYATIKFEDESLKTHLSNGVRYETTTSKFTQKGPVHRTVYNAELNQKHRVHSASDITMFGSDISSGLNMPLELAYRSNDNHQYATNFTSSPRLTSVVSHRSTEITSTTFGEDHLRSQGELSEASDNGLTTDDSRNSSLDTLPRERSQQEFDTEIEKLKAELVILVRQVDVSELELLTLRKQVGKDSQKVQNLSREVVSLKEERDSLSAECERLKAFHRHRSESNVKDKLQYEGADLQSLLEEMRQELNYKKDQNDTLQLQLQKTQESNVELMLAVQDLDEMLEQKNTEIFKLCNKTVSFEKAEELTLTISKCETDDDDEEQKALEEIVKEHRDAQGTYVMEEKMIDLYSETDMYHRDKDEIEMQLEQLELEYEILKQENRDISYKLEQSQLQEQLKMQYECSSSFDNVNELEDQIENLENKLKTQTEEFSGSLATISKLEAQIKSLEEEMEIQAQGFEADLETVTHAKVMQEQRAIRAEEALRKTRRKHTKTAERLQEEVRRLSMQMTSTFDANEMVAKKALADASELHVQKSQLEGMLQRAEEEVQIMRGDMEARKQDYSNQICEKENQLEQMSLELEKRSKLLDHQPKHNKEVHTTFSRQITMLKNEIEMLTKKNKSLSEQVGFTQSLRDELEQVKESVNEFKLLEQRGKTERNKLVSTISFLKKEAEKSLDELNCLKLFKDESDTTVRALQEEMEKLKGKYNALKHSLVNDASEKEQYRKKVFQLRNDLKKKEDALTSIEKKLKDCNGHYAVSDGTNGNQRINISATAARSEVPNLRERIKFLEGEMKRKQAYLEICTNSFSEKENDMQNKIEELERRVKEFNGNITRFCEDKFQKICKENGDITSNDGVPKESRSIPEYPSNTACTPEENGNTVASVERKKKMSSEEESNGFTVDYRDVNQNHFSDELTSLKEKNKLMEGELKDMQERYSEISLKFAEVEGERQQLVMTLRNMKNVMKG